MQKYYLPFFNFVIFLIIPHFIYSQELDENLNSYELRNFGNKNFVQEFTKKKQTVNDYLISFIDSGNFQIASYLLLKKANPNYCNDLGFTPLMTAAMNEDTLITRLLIRKGADVNFRNIRGENALQWATISRNVDQLKILIDCNAEVNSSDENGITPIFYALGYNKYDLLNYANADYIDFFDPDSSVSTTNEMLKLLIKSGADINLVNELDCTPLLFAAFQKDTSLLNILCELGANPNILTLNKVSPLVYATQEGSYGVVKKLIECGAEVNYNLPDGNNSLITAVRANKDSITELLLQNNAILFKKNNLGLTPLHYAAGYGYPYLSTMLISYGARVNEPDIYGNTPLIAAVYSGAQLVIEILIDAGADVNLADKKGNTPLMVAAQFNDTLLIRMLFNAGGDLNSIKGKNINAISVALNNNSVDAFKKLIDLGANTSNPNSTISLYQHSKEIGNQEITSFLASRGLKTKFKPNISNINIYAGFSTSQNDFMLDFGGGMHELNSNLLINVGYKYRPFSNRIIVYRDSYFYQFWEKRHSFYISLQHLLVLKRGFLFGNIGFIPGLSNELSWSFFRGLDHSSGAKWFLVPSIGIFYQRRLFTIIGKWEFANYNNQVNSSNRLNLQFLYSFPTKNRFVEKRIKWLD